MNRLFILLVLLPLAAGSQSLKHSNSGLTLRGKVMSSLFLLEDARCHNLTVGLEYRFTRNFSIGFDYIGLQLVNEEEIPINGSYDNGYNEYWQKTPRHILLADARWYLPRLFEKSRFVLYLNTLVRQGWQHQCQQDLYPIRQNEPVREKINFKDYGFMLGSHIAFGQRGYEFEPCGIDLSLGAINHYTVSDVEYLNPGGENIKVNGLKSNAWMFYMRANIYVNL